MAGGQAGPEAGLLRPCRRSSTDVRPEVAICAGGDLRAGARRASRSASFEDAHRVANDTEYGLTGALYSRTREQLERAASASFHVGNLYLNRKCTGAFVGAHPFGGFNMSGTDSKAGGRDYLFLFTQEKTISEKL